MKNLFDYATSELSQDAFLLWLFDSWKDKEIKPIVHSLLEEFCKIDKSDPIKEIKPNAQWKHCDIRLDIETEKRPKIILLIEDKTFSSEHSNQLETYKKALKNEKSEKHFVFYKTSKIGEKEQERVDEAEWTAYDLEKILVIFRPFENSNVFLVKQYCEHLNELKKCKENTIKPERSETQKDLQCWIGYFNNVIIKSLKTKIEEAGYYAYTASNHYGYSFLIIERIRKGERTLPYLEIRSRDCLNGNFRALVLGYNIDEKVLNTIVPVLTKRADGSDFWETKFQRNKQGKEPKQICYFIPDTPTKNEDFISRVENCFNEYKALISDSDRI